MATLTATGPVVIENMNVAKNIEVPLVSFEKGVAMVVELDGAQVSLDFNQDSFYKATHNGIRYRAIGPRWVATV
tara:strand:+ start:1682 stop:1903 length:222 start_codon:yes stop_codon:yes gene_type:complete